MEYSNEIKKYADIIRPVSEPISQKEYIAVAKELGFSVYTSGMKAPDKIVKAVQRNDYSGQTLSRLVTGGTLNKVVVAKEFSLLRRKEAAFNYFKPERDFAINAYPRFSADAIRFDRALEPGTSAFRTRGTSASDWPKYNIDMHFLGSMRSIRIPYPEPVVALPIPRYVETTDPYTTDVATTTVFQREVQPLVSAYLGVLDAWQQNPNSPVPIPSWLGFAIGGEYPMWDPKLTTENARIEDVEPYRAELKRIAGITE